MSQQNIANAVRHIGKVESHPPNDLNHNHWLSEGWYRYTPKLRGTYTFYVTFAGNSTYLGASTLTKPIKVTVK